jgi:hypothetical protein
VQALRHSRTPLRASTNWRTTCQFQFASGMPTSAGAGGLHRHFQPRLGLGVEGGGGTAGLLKGEGGGAVTIQEGRHLAGRPALRQQLERVPALALARCRRALHPVPCLPCVQLPALLPPAQSWRGADPTPVRLPAVLWLRQDAANRPSLSGNHRGVASDRQRGRERASLFPRDAPRRGADRPAGLAGRDPRQRHHREAGAVPRTSRTRLFETLRVLQSPPEALDEEHIRIRRMAEDQLRQLRRSGDRGLRP